MAQQISCDRCEAEPAAQLLTNLETGDTMALGPACLPAFYGEMTLILHDAGEHKGLPQKCQACRRVHERMTLAARPAQAPPSPADSETTPDAVAAGDGGPE